MSFGAIAMISFESCADNNSWNLRPKNLNSFYFCLVYVFPPLWWVCCFWIARLQEESLSQLIAVHINEILHWNSHFCRDYSSTLPYLLLFSSSHHLFSLQNQSIIWSVYPIYLSETFPFSPESSSLLIRFALLLTFCMRACLWGVSLFLSNALSASLAIPGFFARWKRLLMILFDEFGLRLTSQSKWCFGLFLYGSWSVTLVSQRLSLTLTLVSASNSRTGSRGGCL